MNMNMGLDYEPLILSNLNMAIHLAPEQAIYSYYHRGALKLSHRDWQNGLSDLTRAIELGSTYPGIYQAYIKRAAAYGAVSNYVAAINDATQAKKLCPQAVMPYVLLASAQNAFGYTAEAFRNLNVALTMAPEDKDVKEAKQELEQTQMEPAVSLYNRGEYQEALRVLDDIQQMNGSNYLVYETRAMVLDKIGIGKDAEPLILSNLNSAIQLAPKQAAYSYYIRGSLALCHRDVQNGMSDLTCSIEHSPTNRCAYHAYVLRGANYADQSNYFAAINDATRAIELCPQEALPYALRADCYNEISNRAEAIRNLNIALQLAPSNKVVLDLKNEMGLE